MDAGCITVVQSYMEVNRINVGFKIEHKEYDLEEMW